MLHVVCGLGPISFLMWLQNETGISCLFVSQRKSRSKSKYPATRRLLLKVGIFEQLNHHTDPLSSNSFNTLISWPNLLAYLDHYQIRSLLFFILQRYSCPAVLWSTSMLSFLDQTAEEGRESSVKGKRAEEHRERQGSEWKSAPSKGLRALSTGASGL